MVNHYHTTLPAFGRGFHLITKEIIRSIPEMPENGILHVFIKHTSAGLTINENADPSVRVDFESYFNHIVKEDMPFIVHDMEGPDDMPAHIKSTLVGSSISIPIENGRPSLGTWQGIYLCEFRNAPHQRKVTISIYS